MNTKEATLAEMLFACEAIKVAPADSPFLYTSGLIGPYYVNTHYLCGGGPTSEDILKKITELGENPSSVPLELPRVLSQTIDSFPIYAEILERLASLARPLIEEHGITYVSGGQRRDWFFSVPLAKLLKLPHIYIFNDLSMYDDEGNEFKNTSSAKAPVNTSVNTLHVADLLSVGSSYLSKWIPALETQNITIAAALNCVDRNQGGVENLLEGGIPSVFSLASIDENLFTNAFEKNILDKDQLYLVLDFLKDPFSSMKSFIESNPDFVVKTLNSDPKSQERIKKTLRDDLYKLGEPFLSQFKL